MLDLSYICVYHQLRNLLEALLVLIIVMRITGFIALFTYNIYVGFAIVNVASISSYITHSIHTLPHEWAHGILTASCLLGAAFGSLCAIYTKNWLGYKGSAQCAFGLGIVASLAAAGTWSLAALACAQCLAGVGVGIFSVCLVEYAGAIVPPRHMARAYTALALGAVTGILLGSSGAWVVRAGLHWRCVLGVGAIPAAISLLAALRLPVVSHRAAQRDVWSSPPRAFPTDMLDTTLRHSSIISPLPATPVTYAPQQQSLAPPRSRSSTQTAQGSDTLSDGSLLQPLLSAKGGPEPIEEYAAGRQPLSDPRTDRLTIKQPRSARMGSVTSANSAFTPALPVSFPSSRRVSSIDFVPMTARGLAVAAAWHVCMALASCDALVLNAAPILARAGFAEHAAHSESMLIAGVQLCLISAGALLVKHAGLRAATMTALAGTCASLGLLAWALPDGCRWCVLCVLCVARSSQGVHWAVLLSTAVQYNSCAPPAGRAQRLTAHPQELVTAWAWLCVAASAVALPVVMSALPLPVVFGVAAGAAACATVATARYPMANADSMATARLSISAPVLGVARSEPRQQRGVSLPYAGLSKDTSPPRVVPLRPHIANAPNSGSSMAGYSRNAQFRGVINFGVGPGSIQERSAHV